MRSIAWVLPDSTEVSKASTAGLDARPHGDHGDVAGRNVAIVHRHGVEATFQAVFEARAASEAGAGEVRVVPSIGFDSKMPGLLYLEWLNASVFQAVATGLEVAL
jgi:hypothetical protein